MGAADVGANHKRDRIWIVANANNARFERWKQQPQSSNGQGDMADTFSIRLESKRPEQQTTRTFGESEMADTRSKGWEANEHAGSIDGRAVCGSVSQQGENGAEQHLDNTMFTGLEGTHDNDKSPRWIQQEPGQRCVEVSNASSLGLSGQGQHEQSSNSAQGREREAVELVYGRSPDFWAVERNVGRVADGVAARVDRLKAIGNGQVPLCAATAWKVLTS
jgi:DNA (cytosine-5)-methyltransferase 1